MQKFKSSISERFHKMVNSAQPSDADITAAARELKINVPAYITGLPDVSNVKKKEISNRYIVNTVKHMIDDEKKKAEEDTPFNRLKDKMTQKKIAMRAVVESAARGEISPEEERFLLDLLQD